MRKILIILMIIAIMGMVGFLIYNFKSKKEGKIPSKEFKMPEENLRGKKVVMIVAFRNFRDDEYFVPRGILEKARVEIITASDEKDTAIGADGGEVKVDVLLEDLKVENFNAVIFIGGPGALKHLDNEKSYKIARETIEENKVLAAICISPTILAKAGVLEEKRATVWSSPLNRKPIKILKEHGAIFEDKPVVVDKKILTGNGPGAAREFGEALVETLKKK